MAEPMTDDLAEAVERKRLERFVEGENPRTIYKLENGRWDAMRRDVQHVLAEVSRRSLEGWQDIASAPRDGTVIDVWEGKQRWPNRFWHADDGAWASSRWTMGRNNQTGKAHLLTTVVPGFKPTYWRPLPAPPISEGT